MKPVHFFLIVPLLLLIAITGIYAQEEYNAQNYITPYIGNCTSNPNDASGITVKYEPTMDQIYMESEIRRLREEAERTGIRTESLNQLTNRLSESYGQVIKPGEYYPASTIDVNKPVPFNLNENDNIQNVLLSSSTMTKAVRFAIEYNQATAGRIWAVVAYQGTGSSSTPDTVRVYYSTTHGSTWTLRVTIILGGTDKVNYDDLDLEIIEPASGDKYLWCVYGLRASGGSGRWFAAGFSARIVGTFNIGFFAFSWPAQSDAKKYYNVRITSDNTLWPTGAWVYIVCSFDSANASNIYDNAQKLVRCTNPYTTSPTFSYKADRPGWYMGPVGPAGYRRTLFSDVAFFSHSGDSLIVSFSGVPDSTKLFFSKLSTSAPPGYGNQHGFIGGSQPNDYKYGTQIATNGNSNGGCYAVFTQRTSGINYNKYFRTTNFGNFNVIAGQSLLLGHGTSNPDLMGLRNISTYIYTYTSYGSPNDSVKYHRGTHTSGTSTICERMNSNANMTGTSTPAVCFRRVNNDSCMVGYILSGPTSAWVAVGCTTPFTGISNNQLPAVYSLLQNYPNPFNPTTTISFSIPKAGLVSLKIYDVLGDEIATLVNENMNANNYTVTWDANAFASGVYFYKLVSGDFTDVKKMILVK